MRKIKPETQQNEPVLDKRPAKTVNERQKRYVARNKFGTHDKRLNMWVQGFEGNALDSLVAYFGHGATKREVVEAAIRALLYKVVGDREHADVLARKIRASDSDEVLRDILRNREARKIDYAKYREYDA